MKSVVNDVEVALYLNEEDRYFAIQTTSEGYDYAFYDNSFNLIDGGVLDKPDISTREAIEEILSGAGISTLSENLTFMDYGDLLDKVYSAEQQIEAIPPVSDRTEPEVSLQGKSMADIEETVLSYAQAQIDEMGLHDDAQLHGARVYGSRTREGLYSEQSDIDVVISYSGDIREDDFFNSLHEEGFSSAGIPVDINPISTEKTGSLEDYLETAEKYLDEKSALEPKQIEAEKEPEMKFFVADNMEHPVVGGYHENIGSLQEATTLYEQMSDGTVNHDVIEDNPHLKENPLVQKAVSELEEYKSSQSTEQTKGEETIEIKSQEKSVQKELGNDRKESVVQAFRDRQAKLKAQEIEKPKQKTQTHKKGDHEL
ncbi:MAG: hypothetical protein LUH56_08030 [Oscillospiraceae bacterium]|nr:hypothetical protein [Oscillospiraceae bacterium]